MSQPDSANASSLGVPPLPRELQTERRSTDVGEPSQATISVDALPWQNMLTVSNIIMATLLAVGVGFLFLLLYQFYMVVFIFFIGISLSIAMKPAVSLLNRYAIPPRFSVILIYVLLATVLASFLWLVIPLITTQVLNIIEQIPRYYQILHNHVTNADSSLINSFAAMLPPYFSIFERSLAQEGEAVNPMGIVWTSMANFANGTLLLIVVLLLAYHWTLEGKTLIQRLLWYVPAEKREGIHTFVDELETSIGGYVRGQVTLCTVIGVASATAFWLLGVPNALTLGLILGVLEAVPIIGPLLGAVPAILITLSTAPEKTLWVILILTAIQVLENNLLVPRIMDESVGVNAIVSILAISAFGLLFGILGAILAIPLAAILQILLNRLIFDDAEPLEEEQVAKQQIARNRASVLRLQAQDLARDVRSQARSEENNEESSYAEEEATDQIELLALEVDSLLARRETA